MHGWGGSIASFRALADRLASSFTVTLIDLYGFGDTPHPDQPLTLDDYAEGVKNVLVECGVEEAVFIAHSFGGRVAMRLAATEEAVRGLVLIDSAGMPPRRSLRYYYKVFKYKVLKKFGRAPKRAGSADYAALSGAMKGTFVNIVNESNVRDAKTITVPVLLFWGEKDRDTPMYMCRRLGRLLVNSECVTIPQAGHFSYLEHPEFAYRVIRAFCEAV